MNQNKRQNIAGETTETTKFEARIWMMSLYSLASLELSDPNLSQHDDAHEARSTKAWFLEVEVEELQPRHCPALH